LKVSASGVFSYYLYFGPYDLIVGCSTDSLVTIINEDASFTTVVEYTYNSVAGSFETYTYPAFTTTPSDCGISAYAITFNSGSTIL
jgi:hypothetical protein